MFLDVIKFLRENKIDHRESGKNIGRGWIGAKICPFCGDRQYHLGIHKKSANVSCWKCGNKGWFYDYLMELYDCDRRKVREICKPYIMDKPGLITEEVLNRPTRIKWPIGVEDEFHPCHIQYLKSRGFGFETIQRFELKACFAIPPWKYRVIIPIMYDEKLVAFTARTVCDVDPRYLHCPNDDAVIPVKQCVYNLDLVTDHIMICEGPTDVWRLGTGAVATFGTKFTNRQINMMRKKGVERATILFDPDRSGRENAERMAVAFDMLGIDCQIYKLRDRDPGDLTDDEAQDLRREILGRSGCCAI